MASETITPTVAPGPVWFAVCGDGVNRHYRHPTLTRENAESHGAAFDKRGPRCPGGKHVPTRYITHPDPALVAALRDLVVLIESRVSPTVLRENLDASRAALHDAKDLKQARDVPSPPSPPTDATKAARLQGA